MSTQIVNFTGFSLLLVLVQDVWQVFRLEGSDVQNIFNSKDQTQAQAFFDASVRVFS